MGKTIKLNDDTYIANDVYLTKEHKIGTWIDGKPLYSRTFEVAMPNASTGVQDLIKLSNIPNVNMVWIDTNASFLKKATTFLLPEFYTSSTDRCHMWINPTAVRCSTGINMSDYIAYVTLRYTKTTD